ncbi:MAG TPA: xanthine dehydrogenase family protein molybdopterin-binding subunit [Chloroflexota bacterium]|nr:xanthine dehydrogenase family protein molybdopterin-binding subunit [Chloroflexota bacterium]
MTTEAGGYVGRPLTRREDERLITGRGLFVSDVHLPGEVHLAVLRSPHAHALITHIDVSAARKCEGVLAALSFADLGPDVARLPMLVPHKNLHPQMPYPLADRKVLHVGEPVAVVAAESRYLAEDALDAIEVEYELLPPVTNCEAALEPGAPILHDGAEDNLSASYTQSVGDIDAAFREADLVIEQTFEFGRISGQPMEPRGVVARWERSKLGETLTVWDATQSPHIARRILSDMMHLPQQAIHVIAADVGGGFGIKNRFYAEEFLAPFIARLLGRPARWVEDRHEDLLTTYQAREQIHHLRIAARKDGRILGIHNRLTVDVGAYSPFGLVVPWNSSTTLPGPYKLPAYRAEMRAAYTTKPAMAPYRAAGRPPAVFDVERIMDLVSRRLNLDPAEVRARNFVQPDDFPYRTGLIERDGGDVVYDSGNYPGSLEKALELADVAGFRREQAAARREGRWLGLGIGCYVESTGRGPFESAMVRVDSAGKVVVATGAAPQGQSHETTLAQLCADRLGVRFEDVTVVTGDTDAINLGVGTYASRTAVVAGNAVSSAAQAVRQKALTAAGQLLEASPDDLELEEGEIRVRGVPDRSIPLARVAQVLTSPPPAFTFPPGLEPGLEATNYFHPSGATYSNGVHVAIVEVDPETGRVQVLRYAIVHDCGTVINPAVIDGQCVGGLAQGLGNALYEEMVYDADGQPVTTSYMDYLVPTAMEVPDVALGHLETRSPLNPEGIKGAGEGGTMPVPGAIANAIDDALAPLGVVVDRVPLNPERLRRMIAAKTAA